jgi:pimeloyl-ACP methyl ester carboxylesterase
MLRRAQLAAAAAVDRVAHKVALSRSAGSRARSSAESLGPTERMESLRSIASFYEEKSEGLFVEPASGGVEARETTLADGGRRIDLTFTSQHRSLDPAVAPRLDDDPKNQRAEARLYVGPGAPRPAILLIHGYLGGHFRFEERAFSVPFLRSRGLDVALLVLPFHGNRGVVGRPRFPSSDPRVSIEGFRQAILDARTVIRYLGETHGTTAFGAMGMSLGGYTSALLATVAPELSFVVPMIPLASIADFAAADGRYVGTATQQREQHEAVERAYRVVSPLGRTPLVPREGRLVIAAEADHITPRHHAEKLAAHFQSELVTFPGSHLLQLGRRQAFARVMRMLEKLDLIPR